MTPPFALPSVAQVGALTDVATYARAREHVRLRRVVELDVELGVVWAKVVDAQGYVVRVVGWDGQSLQANCSCGRREGVCDHILAAVLELRRRGNDPAEPPTAGPWSLPAEGLQVGPLHVPMSAEAFDVWSASALIRSVAWTDPLALTQRPRSRAGLVWHSTVRGVMTSVPHSPEEAELAIAVMEALLVRAQAASAALEAQVEARRRRVAPEDAVLAACYAALRGMRGAQPERLLVRDATPLFSERPLGLSVRASEHCLRCGRTAERAVTLLPGPRVVSEPCAAVADPGDCPLRVAALEALMDALAETPASAGVTRFREGAAVPEWLRVLRRVDAMVSPAAPPQPLHFRLEPGAGMEAVAVTERKNGALSARRLRVCPPGLSLADERLFGQFSSGLLRADGAIAKVLLEVAGTDRVLDPADRRIAVMRTTLKPALQEHPTAPEAFSIGARLGPVPLHLEVVQDAVEARQDALYVLSDDGLTAYVALIPQRLALLARALSREGDVVFPAESAADVARRLVGVDPEARIPSRLSGEPLSSALRPVVLVTWAHPYLRLGLGFRHHDDYPALGAASGPAVLWVTGPGGRPAHVARDFSEELALGDRIARWLGLELGSLDPALGTPVPAERCFDVLSLLGAHDAGDRPPGLEVVWAEDGAQVPVAQVGGLRVTVGAGRDWFALGGAMEVKGTSVPLPLLLRAIRERQLFVRASSGELIALSRQLVEALSGLAGAGEARARRGGGEAWGVGLFGALALPTLERAGVQVEAPPIWRALVTRAEAAAALIPELPAGLQATLRPYQREGYEWLRRLAEWAPGACLCDDMGLGKTVQAIALLLARRRKGPMLVVAPTSVGTNWARELERFAPSLPVRTFRGVATLSVLDGLEEDAVVVTSYDLVVQHASRFEAAHWGTLVLDEAQAIKNAATQRARVCAGLDAGFRLALTGTPVENRSEELWSLFNATVPGLLGSEPAFRERFGNTIDREQRGPAAQILAQLVRPFVLRRLKRDVALELPPRTEINVEVTLSPEEEALYDAIRRSALDALDGSLDDDPSQRRMQVLTALMRLRQAACHPRLLDPASTVPSSKLRALLECVDELRAEGHRALVFSQFTSHLALVREALDARRIPYQYLDGATPAARRQQEVDAFQRGGADLFLLSVKAGGTGLNLTGADYVIHLDPWWNPAVEDQATDRAHRIGQERPVTVYRLVAKDTLEHGILALHAKKRELVASLLDGADTPLALSTDELMALIERRVPREPE